MTRYFKQKKNQAVFGGRGTVFRYAGENPYGRVQLVGPVVSYSAFLGQVGVEGRGMLLTVSRIAFEDEWHEVILDVVNNQTVTTEGVECIRSYS